MFLIRKSFTFEAAHQLESAYTAACHECVHGHSYTVEVVLTCKVLDKAEMVVDFGELKAFKAEVMERFDHGLMLHMAKKPHFQPLIDAGVLKASKVSFHAHNPTAEYLAAHLFDLFREVYAHSREDWWKRGVRVQCVRVHETATGWAEYSSEVQT